MLFSFNTHWSSVRHPLLIPLPGLRTLEVDFGLYSMNFKGRNEETALEKIRIILNPSCAMGKGIEALPSLQEAASSMGLDAEIVLTEYPGHAIELARLAAEQGCTIAAAAGGDGTLNEVLNGLMLARTQATTALPWR